jgi:hypothetical protein
MQHYKPTQEQGIMTTGKAWTEEELKTICNVYAAMLHLESIGEKFNKAALRRATLPMLDGRSGGSYCRG